MGEIELTAQDFPVFLYDKKQFDPEQIEKGLFHGYFLVRVCSFFCLLIYNISITFQVFYHIFTGPSSTLAGHAASRGTKLPIANEMGMCHVTLYHIVYTALQAWIILYNFIIIHFLFRLASLSPLKQHGAQQTPKMGCSAIMTFILQCWIFLNSIGMTGRMMDNGVGSFLDGGISK